MRERRSTKNRCTHAHAPLSKRQHDCHRLLKYTHPSQAPLFIDWPRDRHAGEELERRTKLKEIDSLLKCDALLGRKRLGDEERLTEEMLCGISSGNFSLYHTRFSHEIV